MVGLPSCGKTTWVRKCCESSADKNFNIISMQSLLDRCKVCPIVEFPFLYKYFIYNIFLMFVKIQDFSTYILNTDGLKGPVKSRNILSFVPVLVDE